MSPFLHGSRGGEVRRKRSGAENQRGVGKVRWCEGRPETGDRTPLDVLVTVEEAHACSDSYQVRHARDKRDTRYRRQNADRHMLGVLRVKSHAHWMVVQVVKECKQAMKARGKNI